MAVTEKKVDHFFFGIVVALLIIGILIFISASLGLLAKNETKFYGVIFNQIALGLVGGFGILIITSKINYKFWRKYAFYIFLATILLMFLVFIPGQVVY